MKAYLTILFVSLTHLSFSQEKVDLSLLAGWYGDPLTYFKGNMDDGPIQFMEEIPCEIIYDQEKQTGYIGPTVPDRKPFKIINENDQILIEINSGQGSVKKGIIKRCDDEMLRIDFEKTIEEYHRKE